MATVERRNGRFRLIFYLTGKRCSASLRTADPREADAIAGSAERTLMLLQQGVLTVPEGALRLGLGPGLPEVVRHRFRLGPLPPGLRVKHVRGLVGPAPLLPRRRERQPQSLPEAQGPRRRRPGLVRRSPRALRSPTARPSTAAPTPRGPSPRAISSFRPSALAPPHDEGTLPAYLQAGVERHAVAPGLGGAWRWVLRKSCSPGNRLSPRPSSALLAKVCQWQDQPSHLPTGPWQVHERPAENTLGAPPQLAPACRTSAGRGLWLGRACRGDRSAQNVGRPTLVANEGERVSTSICANYLPA